jgi:membrane protein implicated in regulation of membrane protease activity
MVVWVWGSIAVALCILELLMPGYFLIFPAVGALAVGVADLLGLHAIEPQLALFGATSALIFAVTFNQYRRLISNRQQAIVNLPERLVGALGTVEDALAHGRGKIRLGDSVWLARGPDLEKGRAVRVARVEGTVLEVEPTE